MVNKDLIRGRSLFQIIVVLLVALLVGIKMPEFIGTITTLRTGAFSLTLCVVVLIMGLWRREVILYLLALVWVVPISTAGFRSISLTLGLTIWEVLLYTGFAAAVVSDIIHIRSKPWQRNKGRVIIKKGIWAGLLLILLGSLLALNKTNDYGYGNFRYSAMNPLLLFLLAISLIERPEQLARFSFFLLISSVALILVQVLPGYEFVGGRLLVDLVSPLGDTGFALFNRLGLWASAGIPLALCYALGSKKLILRWLSTILYIILISIVLLTSSRGSIMAVIAGTLVVLVLVSWNRRWRRIAVVFVSTALVVFLVFEYIPYLVDPRHISGLENIKYRMMSLIYIDSLKYDEAVLGRSELWRLSWMLFRDQPFGIGYGVIAGITGSWEHNMFVMIMNGAGIFGLCGMILFLISYVLSVIGAMRENNGFVRFICIASLSSLVTTVINGLSMELLAPTYAEPSLLVLALGLCAVKLSSHSKLKTQTIQSTSL